MKVKLKLAPKQLARLRDKDADQSNRYRAYLEDQHLMRARQEFKETDSRQEFHIWFKAWNKVHMKPLKPKKLKFKNNHLMNMKWEDD